MAMIRRILIVVVGIMLIVDASALAYVKFTGGPAPSEEKSKLVLWLDNSAQANGVAEAFKAQGYQPTVSAAKRKSTEEADFRLALKSSKKSLLQPIAEVLGQAGYKGLTYSADGTTLYYGGFYKQKSQANRIAERIRSKEKISFEVVAGERVVSKNSHKVILPSVSANLVPELLSGLDDKYEIADQQEIPIEAKPGEGEE